MSARDLIGVIVHQGASATARDALIGLGVPSVRLALHPDNKALGC